MEERLGPSKDNPPNMQQFKFPMLEALKKHLSEISQEQFDAEWAEIEALGLEGPSFDEHEKITGFNTPAEFSAYCLGRHDEEVTIIEWIKNWDGSVNSQLGQILTSKVKERDITQILKEELERAFKHGQTNAQMMEAGLERDEVNEYVNFRMLALKDKI